MSAAIFPFLRVIERFTTDRGAAYAVELDRDTHDFSHIIGEECLIDGDLRRVASVERNMHMPPWHIGERIVVYLAPTTQ